MGDLISNLIGTVILLGLSPLTSTMHGGNGRYFVADILCAEMTYMKYDGLAALKPRPEFKVMVFKHSRSGGLAVTGTFPGTRFWIQTFLPDKQAAPCFPQDDQKFTNLPSQTPRAKVEDDIATHGCSMFGIPPID